MRVTQPELRMEDSAVCRQKNIKILDFNKLKEPMLNKTKHFLKFNSKYHAVSPKVFGEHLLQRLLRPDDRNHFCAGT